MPFWHFHNYHAMIVARDAVVALVLLPPAAVAAAAIALDDALALP